MEDTLSVLFRTLNLDVNAKSIVTKLLMRIPSLRLGMLRNGSDELWEHPFFQGTSQNAVIHGIGHFLI
jgi:hypothetical protein